MLWYSTNDLTIFFFVGLFQADVKLFVDFFRHMYKPFIDIDIDYKKGLVKIYAAFPLAELVGEHLHHAFGVCNGGRLKVPSTAAVFAAEV